MKWGDRLRGLLGQLVLNFVALGSEIECLIHGFLQCTIVYIDRAGCVRKYSREIALVNPWSQVDFNI